MDLKKKTLGNTDTMEYYPSIKKEWNIDSWNNIGQSHCNLLIEKSPTKIHSEQFHLHDFLENISGCQGLGWRKVLISRRQPEEILGVDKTVLYHDHCINTVLYL